MNAPSSLTAVPARGPLQPDGPFDIQHAASVREQLLAQPPSPALVLDLSAVPVCDLTGLQVLLAARATTQAAGGTFIITALSPAVTEACRSLGLDPSVLTHR